MRHIPLRYGSVAGELLATPVARGMVGAATPRTLVTELPLELAIHRFPEISTATLVGELSPALVYAVVEIAVPLELKTEMELVEFTIHIWSRPSMARAEGVESPPSV